MHFCTKREGLLWGNTGWRQDGNPAGQTPNPVTLSYTKGLLGSNSSGLTLLSAVLTTKHLPWAGSTACLQLCLASILLLWPSPNILVSNAIHASHYGFFGPPCRDSPAIHLALAVFFNLWGRFHNPLLLYPSMTKARTIWLKLLLHWSSCLLGV